MLWHAAKVGDTAGVEAALAAGAAMDCLVSLVREGKQSIANPSVWPGEEGTPLWAAAKWGHEAVVGQLLEAGAAVDHGESDIHNTYGPLRHTSTLPGQTPLQVATTHNHYAVMGRLLAAGAATYNGHVSFIPKRFHKSDE